MLYIENWFWKVWPNKKAKAKVRASVFQIVYYTFALIENDKFCVKGNISELASSLRKLYMCK